MMVLLFRLGSDRYAIDVANVVEVVPNLPLQALSRVPDYVRGLLNYRGVVTPVVDLMTLLMNRHTSTTLSSRIILIEYCDEHFVGLLAEHVTETMKVDPDMFGDAGVSAETCNFVDGVAVDEIGMIQKVNVDAILPEEVKGVLEKCVIRDTDGKGQVD